MSKDSFEVVFYNKFSGHMQVKKDSFEEALEFAEISKKDIYKEDEDVIDKTFYIGVESNNKFAIVYMTKDYYNYIKTLPENDFTDEFLKYAENYIEM